MSRELRKRRPRGALSRRDVTLAALRVIDRDGLDGLTMRTLAAELKCGTMTLYSHVTDREDLLSGVVALLIEEMDLEWIEGESWQNVGRRIADSYRNLAYRHPQAFELLALAQDDEAPVAPYLERILWLMQKGGLSEPASRTFLSVADGFTSGFLVMAVRDHGDASRRDNTDPIEREWSHLAQLQAAEAYDAGFEVVLAGIERMFGYEKSGPDA